MEILWRNIEIYNIFFILKVFNTIMDIYYMREQLHE